MCLPEEQFCLNLLRLPNRTVNRKCTISSGAARRYRTLNPTSNSGTLLHITFKVHVKFTSVHPKDTGPGSDKVVEVLSVREWDSISGWKWGNRAIRDIMTKSLIWLLFEPSRYTFLRTSEERCS